MQYFVELDGTKSDGIAVAIEYFRIILNPIEICEKAFIAGIVVVFQPGKNSLEAHANCDVVSVGWVYLKIDVVDKEAIGRIFA